jgi:hypothetical protein
MKRERGFEKNEKGQKLKNKNKKITEETKGRVVLDDIYVGNEQGMSCKQE